MSKHKRAGKIMKPETKKYIKIAVISAVAVMICIAFYFLILRYYGFFKWVGKMMNTIRPFIYGAVMSYLLMPLTARFENTFAKLFRGKKKNLSDGLAAFCALFIGFVVVLAVIMLIIPQLIESTMALVKTLPTDLDKAQKFVEEAMQREPVLLSWAQEYVADINQTISNFINRQLLPNIKTIGISVMGGVASVVVMLKNLIIGVIIALFILLKRRQFLAQIKLIFHSIFNDKAYGLIAEEISYADKMFNGFFMGKLKDSAVIGVLCFIGCLILRYRSPLLIAVIIGVTNIIPFFGPFIGAVPCALLLLLENPMHCLTFIIFIIVLQQLDGNVIGPKILGDTTGLSSFWVLFSILFFGDIWGIVGMVVGVPLFAVIYDIIKKLVYLGLKKKDKAVLIEDYNSSFHATPEPPKESKKRGRSGKN